MAERSARRRFLRYAALLLTLSVTAFVLFGDRLLAPIIEWILVRNLPGRAGRVDIGSIRVHGLHGATATAVRLTLDTSGSPVTIDSVATDFVISELFSTTRRRIHRLAVYGMRISAAHGPAEWQWVAALVGDTTGQRVAAAGRTPMIDRLEIRNAGLQLGEGGNTLTVDSIEVTATAMGLSPAPQLQIEHVGFRAHHPGLGAGWLRGEARASLADGMLNVDTAVLVDTAGGRLSARGAVVLNPPARRTMSLQVSGNGFLLGQLHPLLSRVLRSGQRADIQGTFRGTLTRPELDARIDFPDGGYVRATSRLMRVRGAPTLDVHAVIGSLDVAHLTGGALPATPVGGRVDGRLDVTTPDSADGPVTLDIHSRIAGRPIALRGRADFVRGEARLNLDLALLDITGWLRGTARPTGTEAFDLRSRLHVALPLPDFVTSRAPGWRGPWEARAHLRGQGLSPDRTVATLDAQVATSQEAAEMGDGTLHAELAHDTAVFTSRIQLGPAVIEARGDVALREWRSHWRVRRLALRDLALGPWLGRPDSGRLTASLTARTAGSSIIGAVLVDSIAGGRFAGLGGDLAFAVTGGRATLRGRLRDDAASVQLDTLVLLGTAPHYVALSFQGVDPAIADPALPHGSIRGMVRLAPVSDPAAGPPSGMRATAVPLAGRLTIDSSTLSGRPIVGTVLLGYRPGDVTFDGAIASGDQRVEFRGGAAVSKRSLALHLDRGRVRRVDPAVWAGDRFPSGQVNAVLQAEVAGTALQSATANVQLSLDSTTIAGLTLDHGDVTLALRGGRAHLTGGGRVGAVAATIEARASTLGRGAWEGGGTAWLTDTTLQAPDSLPLPFEFSFSDTGAWRFAVSGRGSVAGLELDSLAAAVVLSKRGVTVRRLLIVGPDLDVRGSGRVPSRTSQGQSATLVVSGSTPGLGALLDFTGRRGFQGRASFALRSSGSGPDVRHVLRLGLGGFHGNGLAVDSAVIDVTARSGSTAWLAAASARAVISGPHALMFLPVGLPVAVGLGSAATSAERLSVGFAWSAAGQSVRVTELVAQLGAERWVLERPATIGLAGPLDIGEIVLRSDTGQVRLVGRLDRQAAVVLAVDVAGLPVQLRSPDGEGALATRVDLRLRLSGTAADPLLQVEGGFLGRTRDQNATGSGEWTARRLRLDFSQRGVTGQRIEVHGTLPVGLSLAAGAAAVTVTRDSVGLHFGVTDLDLTRLAPVLPAGQVSGLSGRLQADVRVGGKADAPQWSGSASLDGFTVTLAAYGTTLAIDHLGVTLAGQRLTLDSTTLRSGRRGTLGLSGTIDFPELTSSRLAFRLRFDHFRPTDNAKMKATVSGALALGGSLSAPQVSGALHVDEATYEVSREDMPSQSAEIHLTDADYREVARRFGVGREARTTWTNRRWQAATIDVSVSADSRVWVRHSYEPHLAVEVAGRVRVRKPSHGDLGADGEMHVVEGRSSIQEFGRYFTIARGTARFSGPISAVEVEGQAVYQPDDSVTIRLDLRGDPQGLSLTLSSDPAMEEADIVWYLAFGVPGSDASQFGPGAGLERVGAGIAFTRIGGGMEALARRTLGLDVVTVHQDGLRGLTFTAGRYVSPRLYIGFVQPIVAKEQGSGAGDTDAEIEADYRATAWLLMNMSGSRSLARFFLKTSHAY